MHGVIDKFDATHSWYLPVVTRDNKFTGFVLKITVFDKYREVLPAQGDLYG